MAIAIVGSLMLGAFLAQFYKYFILVPVIALISAAELAGAVYCECGLLRPLWHFALMATSLQIGYVAIPVSYAVLDLLRSVKLLRKVPPASIAARRRARHPKKLLNQ